MKTDADGVIGVYNNPSIVKIDIFHNNVVSNVILNKDERFIFYEDKGISYIGKQRTNRLMNMNRNKKIVFPLLNEVIDLGGRI